MVKAFGRGEIRPGGDKHSTATKDIVTDIVEIGGWQNAPQPVAIEDDQVELLDLLDKKLPRREGDQRQLADRHPVLLVGRAQDGEMHQIDGTVGFQKVPPGPFARIRLPRD